MDPAPFVVFLFVIVSVACCSMTELRLYIPKTRWSLSIDYAAPPLLGVLILWILNSLTMTDMMLALEGDENIQPFAILTLFISLAYLSVSLDLTGVFAYLGLTFAKKTGGSAFLLYVSFFILSGILTVLTSSDIVILSVSPIVCYCCFAAQLNPIPFLFASFFSANLCSLVLLVGNPSTVIAREIIDDSMFQNYSVWMLGVAFAAVSTCFFLLYFLFRNHFNQVFVVPPIDPKIALQDKTAAIVHSSILCLTPILIWVSPLMHAPVWIICAIAALLIFIYNLLTWPWKVYSYTLPPVASLSIGDTEQPFLSDASIKHTDSIASASSSSIFSSNLPSSTTTSNVGPQSLTQLPSENTKLLDLENPPAINSSASALDTNNTSVDSIEWAKFLNHTFGTLTPRPTLLASFAMLPWRVIPFVFGMFILVETLKTSGWVDAMGHFLIALIPENPYWSVIISSYLMTFISFFFSTFITNQTTTHLLYHIIIHSRFSSLPKVVQSVSVLGMIVGATIGANITFVGSLAGMMFATIVSEKGIILSYWNFFKTGLRIMPLVYLLSVGLLCIEHLIHV